MECLTGISAAAVGAQAVFGYNRENFLYDRKQRMRKEFKLQKFRVAQASLWREDVRDLISLTEYKMHIYLLVNVLLLGFTIVLWCEGRLPTDTPDWLMMGSALSTTGAFMFLLLSMWLALHAAVAAQSYEARLLTQLVRLPIPSWQEIEACRTYASDFERTDLPQMLRLPFLMGRQETLAARVPAEPSSAGGGLRSPDLAAADNPAASNAPAAAAAAATAADPAAVLAADPWGYERGGDDVYELGCQYGSQVARLRHIRLARQAMAYWQSYDAFSRISLSIGINQLLLALSYYILGYILVEVGCRTAATYGVLLLCGLAEAMAKLDMSLSIWQLRQIQFLLAVGPIMSCVAAYRWSFSSFESFWFAEILIVLSFLSHGILLALMVRFCYIKPQENGTMLPTAFRGVLYLDVFGWLRGPVQEAASGGLEAASPPVDARGAPSAGNVPAPAGGVERDGIPSGGRPALGAVDRAFPCRPEDFAPAGAVQDLRDVPGAPSTRQPRSEGMPSGSEFYDAEFWLSGDAHADPDGARGSRRSGEFSSIITGHEKEVPRILPWRVFCFFAVVLSFAWILAAVYHLLGATRAWDFDVQVTWEPEDDAAPAPPGQEDPGGLNASVESISLTSITEVITSRISARYTTYPERISVSWPHPNIKPIGMSCDDAGHHFVVTDGLRMYSAELSADPANNPGYSGGTEASRAFRRPGASDQRRAADGPAFAEVRCPAVAGEGLQDVAVVCGTPEEPAGCEGLALHRHGRRVTTCQLGRAAAAELPEQATWRSENGQNGSTTLTVVDTWLERLRTRPSTPAPAGDGESAGGPHGRVEKAVALASDGVCTGASLGCVLVGTTRGRVVRLQRRLGSQELLPVEAVHDANETRAGAVRAYGPWLLLEAPEGAKGRRRLLVRDLRGHGRPAGHLRLPPGAGGAFCLGGGHLHVLLQGPSPGMWRLPLPRNLRLQAPPSVMNG